MAGWLSARRLANHLPLTPGCGRGQPLRVSDRVVGGMTLTPLDCPQRVAAALIDFLVRLPQNDAMHPLRCGERELTEATT